MACKSPSRKRPRRPPPKEAPIDDELHELAAVIAEHQLDNNANGWFLIPWRSGWNAVELANRAACHDRGDCELLWLDDVCRNRTTSEDTYWTAQDLLATTTTPNRTLRAALRCLQVMLAKSDGGGEVYNAILLGVFSAFDPVNVEDLVLEYRCRDSIGVSSRLAGDANDRLRRAFSIAWKRGLYAAAYSLPQATLRTIKGGKEP